MINNLIEKDLNLVIAKECKRFLSAHGVAVKISREIDKSMTVSEKIEECNEYNPTIAIDIHNNSGGGKGAEIFHHYGGGLGKEFSESILNEFAEIGQTIRGSKIKVNSQCVDYYGFIRETNAPAIIIECAFMDHEADVKLINTEQGLKKFGVAIAKGILVMLGIPYENGEETDRLYRVQVGAFIRKSNAERMKLALQKAGFDAVIV